MIMPVEDPGADDVRNNETAKLETLRELATTLMQLLMNAQPTITPEQLREQFNPVFATVHPAVISDAIVGATAIQSVLRQCNGRRLSMQWDPRTAEYVMAFQADDGTIRTARDPEYFLALAESCEALRDYTMEQDGTVIT